MDDQQIPEFPLQSLICSQSERMKYGGYDADPVLVSWANLLIPESWVDISKKSHRVAYLQSVADSIDENLPNRWGIVRHESPDLHRATMVLAREVRPDNIEKALPLRTPALYQLDIGLQECGDGDHPWELYLHLHRKPVHPDGEDARTFVEGAKVLSGLVSVQHDDERVDDHIAATLLSAMGREG